MMRFRRGIALAGLALGLLAACGAASIEPERPGGEASAVTAEQILADLRGRGLSPALAGQSAVGWLSEAPGASYRLAGGWLHLHTYGDQAGAEAAAARIPPNADTGMTDWVDVPHFFRCDAVIALFLGTDQAVLDALRDRCGPQFAGQ